MENQKSIEFEEFSHAPSLIQERISNVKSSVNSWLHSKSEFYSRIAGYPVTWIMAIRIGIVLPLLLVIAAITVAKAPVVAVISGLISAWIVYRIN
jgi:hypothetical protein